MSAPSLCVCYSFSFRFMPLQRCVMCFPLFMLYSLHTWSYHGMAIALESYFVLFYSIFGPHSFNAFRMSMSVVWYGMVWCGMAVAACVSVCMYVWLAQQYVLIHSLLRACFLLVPPPPLLLLFVSIIHLIFRFCTAVRADDFVYATSHIYACKTIAVRTGANKRFFIK